MDIYLVGGAVRDSLLGLTVHERDWLVVGSSVAEMLEQGFIQPDEKFPVFLHPQTKEEYALARREIKSGIGYKGFDFDVSTDVTLEEDLLRRDLTINAIAQDADDNLIDPFNGQDDLQFGWLRHVSERFIEDPLRLLRLCRFNSKLGHAGFRPTHNTWRLMKKMATAELKSISIERQWKEMSRALAEAEPWRYFLLLKGCGALEIMQPLLAKQLIVLSSHNENASLEWVKNMRLAVKQKLSPAQVLVASLMATPLDEVDVEKMTKALGAGKKVSDLLMKVIFLKHNFDIFLVGKGQDFLHLLEQLGFQKQPVLFASLLSIINVTDKEKSALVAQRIETAKQVMTAVTAQQFLQQGIVGKELGIALIKHRGALFDEYNLKSNRDLK